MITQRQIRAARALLGWDAAELASRAGLTRATVSNIENDVVQAREGSIEKIVRVFDENEVEFTENQGVRFKSTDIEVFRGPDRFHDFTDFVYEHMKRFGGEVCISTVDEMQFNKYRKDPELYRQQMKELVESGKVTVRILATESKFNSIFAKMRWQPKQTAVPVSFYAFGSCLALISFAQQPAPYVVLHKSGPFAEAYKQSFNVAWENAKEPPKEGQRQ